MKRFASVLLIVILLLSSVCTAEEIIRHYRMRFEYEYGELAIVYGDKEALIQNSDWSGNSSGHYTHARPFEEGELIHSGAYSYKLLEDGTAALMVIRDSRQEEKLKIPDEIDGIPVTRLGMDVNSGIVIGNSGFLSDRVKEISFPETLKVIGAGFTADNYNLKQLIYPEGVEEIGAVGRHGYSSYLLTKITLPKKSLRVLGEFAFAGCSVKQLVIPEGVTSIGFGGFMNSSLSSISLPSTVVDAGDFLFYGCRNLTTVKLAEGFPAITKGMFLNCPKLSSITIPKSVTSMGENAFEDCVKLATVKFSDESLTAIPEAAFRRCSALQKITIPAGVTEIGKDAFYGCSKLSSVTLPASVTSIGTDAFESCSSKLTFIVQPDSYAEQWAVENSYTVKVAKKK